MREAERARERQAVDMDRPGRDVLDAARNRGKLRGHRARSRALSGPRPADLPGLRVPASPPVRVRHGERALYGSAFVELARSLVPRSETGGRILELRFEQHFQPRNSNPM